MSINGWSAVARARDLIGTRFLPQGRDPSRGIDCLGIVILAYAIDAERVPDDYRLSGDHRAAVMMRIAPWFRRVSRRRILPGDLLVLRPAADQWHFAIWSGEGVIDADAARRAVVERPGPARWPIAAAFRRRVRNQRKA